MSGDGGIDIEAGGAAVTAGLATAALGAGGAHDRQQGDHGHHCANCAVALTGPYCHACGQHAHVHRSLLHLGEEVLHGILHFDAKGWRTIPLLVARPGLLTRRYIDGHRVRYVSPLALFLFTVFLMFFVVSSTTGGMHFNDAVSQAARHQAGGEAQKAVEEQRAEVVVAERALAAAQAKGGDVEDARADLAQAQMGLRISEQVRGKALAGSATGPGAKPPGVEKPGHSAEAGQDDGWPDLTGLVKSDAELPAGLRHALKNPELALYKLKNTAYKFSFMLVPISLPFLWLMFVGRRGVTMYDHAVFSLYSLSFMSLLFVVLAVIAYCGLAGPAMFLLCALPPLHMFVQLRGAYGLGLWAALWRTALLLIVVVCVFSIFTASLLVMTMR